MFVKTGVNPMQEAITLLCLLFIVQSGFSVLASPVFGHRLDPFFLVRPLARWIIKLPARTFRWLSKLFNRWSGLSWQRARRTQSLSLKITLYLTSAALGTIGMLLTVPAELLGEIKRL